MQLLEHNRKAVEKIMAAYNRCNDVCYVSGVGTGKTYVFMAVAEQIDGKILYVYPKHTIGANVRSYKDFRQLASRVNFITYNAFKDEDVSEVIVSKYSLVVIDECHHVTSDVYGMNLITALNNCKRYVLGLTATPVIGGRDCRHYFKETVIGLSNIEAIRQSLMPVIQYCMCLPEYSKELIKAMLLQDIDFDMDKDKSYNLLNGIVSNLNIDRWITFHNSHKSLLEYKDLIERLFPAHEVVIITSFVKNSKYLLEYVQSVPKVVIMCCDMLTEGIHLSNVNGIILFRNIRASNLFTQIIGRVCSIGNTKSPMVIDCSECAYKLLRELVDIEKSSEEASSKDKRNKPVVEISVNRSISVDISELLSSLDNDNKFLFRGIEYQSLKCACEQLGVSYDDVLDFKKKYKMSLLNSFTSVYNKNSFSMSN